MKAKKKNNSEKDLYQWQNRKIHQARAQIGMTLDDCRELAREIGGKASISSLTLQERWKLIEELKSKGARIFNPPLGEHRFSKRENDQSNRQFEEERKSQIQENPEDIYPTRLKYWNKRFPKRRPGFASNEQLAWIQALWELDFDGGRAGESSNGLRKFIYRQTMSLKQGPISDLAFLRDCHVKAVMTPLKVKAEKERR